jgi:hypothetical protein
MRPSCGCGIQLQARLDRRSATRRQNPLPAGSLVQRPGRCADRASRLTPRRRRRRPAGGHGGTRFTMLASASRTPAQVFEPRASRACVIITELTAMTLSDSAASRVPSSTRSSRSGAASPSSRRCRACLAELSASCRARCTAIVVESVLLTSLLRDVSGAWSPHTSSRSLTARIRKRTLASAGFLVPDRQRPRLAAEVPGEPRVRSG